MDKLNWLEASITAAVDETVSTIENEYKGIQGNLYRLIRLSVLSLPDDLKSELFAVEEEVILNLRMAMEASFRRGFEQGFALRNN